MPSYTVSAHAIRRLIERELVPNEEAAISVASQILSNGRWLDSRRIAYGGMVAVVDQCVVVTVHQDSSKREAKKENHWQGFSDNYWACRRDSRVKLIMKNVKIRNKNVKHKKKQDELWVM